MQLVAIVPGIVLKLRLANRIWLISLLLCLKNNTSGKQIILQYIDTLV